MDRLTKEQIEAVWRDVKYLYERSVPNVYPAAYERLRAPFDLALQSLSLESVRSETLEEAARVAELHAGDRGHFGDKVGEEVGENIADMIRALQKKTHG